MEISVLLIISGSIAAYKSLELIRLLQQHNIDVDVVLTRSGAQFVTPLSITALTKKSCYTELFDTTAEAQMGHIELSRRHNLVLIAPASADIIAKMNAGICDDLASTLLLASDKPILIAPAMNSHMWQNPATQRNIHSVAKYGAQIIPPQNGELACGETGPGRMAEPNIILDAVINQLANISADGTSKPCHNQKTTEQIASINAQPLAKYKAIVTAGPTREPIDPVRFISNHSSGKQGIAIANALAKAGAQVNLILGPVEPQIASTIYPQENIIVRHVYTAADMLAACKESLPADIAICTAAVADWTPTKPAEKKLKKLGDSTSFNLSLQETTDIAKWLAQQNNNRPELVVAFAAETDNILKNAKQKLLNKQCDWILANNVTDGKIFGSDNNEIYLITNADNNTNPEHWQGSKAYIADRLITAIAQYFNNNLCRKTA